MSRRYSDTVADPWRALRTWRRHGWVQRVGVGGSERACCWVPLPAVPPSHPLHTHPSPPSNHTHLDGEAGGHFGPNESHLGPQTKLAPRLAHAILGAGQHTPQQVGDGIVGHAHPIVRDGQAVVRLCCAPAVGRAARLQAASLRLGRALAFLLQAGEREGLNMSYGSGWEGGGGRGGGGRREVRGRGRRLRGGERWPSLLSPYSCPTPTPLLHQVPPLTRLGCRLHGPLHLLGFLRHPFLKREAARGVGVWARNGGVDRGAAHTSHLPSRPPMPPPHPLACFWSSVS